MKKLILLITMFILTGCSDKTLEEYAKNISFEKITSYNFNMLITGVHKNEYINNRYVIRNDENEKYLIKDHPDFSKIQDKFTNGYYKDVMIENNETFILNDNFKYEKTEDFISFKNTDIFLDLVSELEEVVTNREEVYQVIFKEKDVYNILSELNLDEKTTGKITGSVEVIDEKINSIKFKINSLEFEITYSGIIK